ncbi:hypothetical protein tpqmel_0053 [Candidatus Gastranaerophilus sp. (ex Termes propinquus)]|nr:hypothetical protein tpqmel_0053 [Candidatus Gastranaerophilus sp. (ex Termes propinquus)]
MEIQKNDYCSTEHYNKEGLENIGAEAAILGFCKYSAKSPYTQRIKGVRGAYSALVEELYKFANF